MGHATSSGARRSAATKQRGRRRDGAIREMIEYLCQRLRQHDREQHSRGTGGGIEFEPADSGRRRTVTCYSSIVAGNLLDLDARMEHQRGAGTARRRSPRRSVQLRQRLFHLRPPGNPRPTDIGVVHLRHAQPAPGPAHAARGRRRSAASPPARRQPGHRRRGGRHHDDEQRDAWIQRSDPGPPPPTWTMFDPLVDGDGDGTAVRDLGAYERNDRWQTELLAVRAQGPSPYTVVTMPTGYDRGAGTAYAAASATGRIRHLRAARRRGRTLRRSPSARAGTPTPARFAIDVANDPAGPWTALGTEQDGYGATRPSLSLGPFPTPLFATPGEKLVRFTVTGRNPASAGYRLYLDYVDAKKSTSRVSRRGGRRGRKSHLRAPDRSGRRPLLGRERRRPARRRRQRRPAEPARRRPSFRASPPSRPGPRTPACSPPMGAFVVGGATTTASSATGRRRRARRRPEPRVLSGVKAIAAGRAHTCALTTERRGPLLGRQRFRPARRRDDGRPVAAPDHGRAFGRQGDRRGRQAHLRGHDRRRRPLLGRERLRPARRRDDESTGRRRPPRDVAADIAAVSAGDRTPARSRARAACAAGDTTGTASWASAATTSSCRRRATDVLSGVKQVVAGNVFTCALTDERRRPLLGLQQPRRDWRRHDARRRSPEPRRHRRPRRRGEPRRGVHATCARS